jgi:hypothetical protein
VSYTDVKVRALVEVDDTKLAGIAQRVNVVVQAVKDVLARTLRDAFAALNPDVIADINLIAPKATGQLRENLEANFASSRVWDTGMSITLGTDIQYARFVNQMPQSSLAHSGGYRYVNYYGYSYKYGGMKRKGVHHAPGTLQVVGTPVYLNDPGAQHNWMQFLVLHAKKWLNDYLRQFLAQHAAAAGLKFTAGQAGLKAVAP